MLGKPCKARPGNEEMRISDRKGAVKRRACLWGNQERERLWNPKRPGG